MTERYTTKDEAEVWIIKHCSDERVGEFIESKMGEGNVTVVDTGVWTDKYGDVVSAVVEYNVEDEFDFTTFTNPFALSKFLRDSIVTLTSLSEDDVDEMTAEQQNRVFEKAVDKIEDVYGDK